MSDTTVGAPAIREIVARIDRTLDENAKLRAEQGKLMAEQAKLNAEAAKLRVDRFLAPLLAFGVLAGATGGLITLLFRGLGTH